MPHADDTAHDNASDDVQLLRLVVRHLYTAEGERPQRLTVFCPRRRECLEVVECCACPRFATYTPSLMRRPYGALMCSPSDGLSEGWRDDDTLALRRTIFQRMAERVVCVEKDVDMTRVRELLARFDATSVVVVDDKVRPLGLISRGDEGLGPEAAVAGDHMAPVTPVVAWGSADPATRRIAAGVSLDIPLTGNDGEVVGLVRRTRVLRSMAQATAEGPRA